MSLTRRRAVALAFAPIALASGAAPTTADGADDPRWADDPRLATLWRCTYPDCPGYIYDPLLGEDRVGTPPRTAFEDLTDAFYCPECGSGREVFIRDVDRASL